MTRDDKAISSICLMILTLTSFSITVVRSCLWSSRTLLVLRTCLIFSLFGLTLSPLASSAGMETTDWDMTVSSRTFSVRPILVSTCSDWVDFSLYWEESRYIGLGCRLISELEGFMASLWS